MEFLLAVTILLAPSYIIRFSFFVFPTNLLMVWVVLLWVICFIFISIKKLWPDAWQFLTLLDKKLLTSIGLLVTAGFISLFIRGIDQKKVGQFIVLILQPISLFFIFGFLKNLYPKQQDWAIKAIYLLLGLMGVFALIQYFTLIGLPPAWWGNNQEPKRAIGFFIHPNFYALFITPLLAFLIPDAVTKIQQANGKLAWIYPITWLVGAIGLLLSLSRAGWLGLVVAVLCYAIIAADKKTRLTIFGIAIITAGIVYAVPNLRWRLITPFLGEKSTTSRITLWKAGWTGMQESPLTGLGLTGFSKQYQNLIPDTNLDTHNFPHNIFLDFWVELGLLGLISFIALAVICIYQGFRDRRNVQMLGVALFFICMISQGLIDNPYFKNDLALIFWLILSMNIYAYTVKKAA